MAGRTSEWSAKDAGETESTHSKTLFLLSSFPNEKLQSLAAADEYAIMDPPFHV
jgi:hypothetical protein